MYPHDTGEIEKLPSLHHTVVTEIYNDFSKIIKFSSLFAIRLEPEIHGATLINSKPENNDEYLVCSFVGILLGFLLFYRSDP